jgi:hypothetical protein
MVRCWVGSLHDSILYICSSASDVCQLFTQGYRLVEVTMMIVQSIATWAGRKATLCCFQQPDRCTSDNKDVGDQAFQQKTLWGAKETFGARGQSCLYSGPADQKGMQIRCGSGKAAAAVMHD